MKPQTEASQKPQYGAFRLAAGLLCALAIGATACDRAPERPELLLLVTVDTLRADRLGAHGSDLGLTPNLDRLATESVVFDSAYAAAPFTLPSLSALMTGRYPEELGIFRNESRFPDSVPTLASELAKHGWKTRAVVSNFILRESSGIGAGFEIYDDDFPQLEVVRKWPERVAPDTTDAALRLLDECAPSDSAPCFLWVHYQDPHGPYTPPETLLAESLQQEAGTPDAERELPLSADQTGLGSIPAYQVIGEHRDIGFYRAAYHAEIRYVDAEIGRLLRGLEERGLRDRTLVTFTTDHGEGLGEDDYWFAHGEYLHDAQVRTPLMFRIPGHAPERRSDITASTDVFPTLLATLGVPGTPPPGTRDLFAATAGEAASRPYFASLGGSTEARYGMIDGDYKLVVTQRKSIGDGRLTKRDGGTDLTAAAPQVAKKIRNKLLRQRKRIANGHEEIRQDLSDEERRGLEALGYVETHD